MSVRCHWCRDGFIVVTGIMCRACSGSGRLPGAVEREPFALPLGEGHAALAAAEALLAPVTFDDSFAACVARWGPPSWTCDGSERKTLPIARWNDGSVSVALVHSPGIAIVLSATAPGAETWWTLADHATAADAITPLAEALDKADAFRADHAR